jgi:hypothetical protein
MLLDPLGPNLPQPSGTQQAPNYQLLDTKDSYYAGTHASDDLQQGMEKAYDGCNL